MDLNTTEVLIDGTVYHLSSRENEAYLQRVASYLNDKIGMIKKDRGYGHLSPEYQSLLIQLNLADDYFKEQAHSAELEEERNSLEKDSYNLKHELVTLQMKVDSLQSENDSLKAELDKEKSRKENSRKRAARKSAAASEEEPLEKADTAAAGEEGSPVKAEEATVKAEAAPARAESAPVKAEAAPAREETAASVRLDPQKNSQKHAQTYKGGSGGSKH